MVTSFCGSRDQAHYNLAIVYYSGIGTTKDFSTTVRLWRSVAEQGNVNAQYKLGLSYGNSTKILHE